MLYLYPLPSNDPYQNPESVRITLGIFSIFRQLSANLVQNYCLEKTLENLGSRLNCHFVDLSESQNIKWTVLSHGFIRCPQIVIKDSFGKGYILRDPLVKVGLFSETISRPCLTIQLRGCSSKHFGEAFSWDNQIVLYWPISTSPSWNTSPSPRSMCMWPHCNSIVFVFPDPSVLFILFSPFSSRYISLFGMFPISSRQKPQTLSWTLKTRGPVPAESSYGRWFILVHSHPVQPSNYLNQQFIDGVAKAFDFLMACLQT